MILLLQGSRLCNANESAFKSRSGIGNSFSGEVVDLASPLSIGFLNEVPPDFFFSFFLRELAYEYLGFLTLRAVTVRSGGLASA